jgi:nucleotidyltransferase/DNA polymerase involved in DNA repair
VRDERKEQEKQDRAIRQINAAEKLNPNAVAADGRNHVSKAAALARAEFAARHAAPILKAADKQLNEIKANTIVVQQIKSQ